MFPNLLPFPFPYEQVPDGMVFAAHHYNYLALAAFFAVLTAWDDYRRREPLVSAGSLAVGLFAFLFMWPVPGYHSLGAALAILGPLALVVSVFRPGSPWRRPPSDGGYPLRTGVAAVVLSLGALDDAVEHAFPVGSPLDAGFHVLGVHGSFITLTAAFLGLLVAWSGWDRLRRFLGYGSTNG